MGYGDYIGAIWRLRFSMGSTIKSLDPLKVYIGICRVIY